MTVFTIVSLSKAPGGGGTRHSTDIDIAGAWQNRTCFRHIYLIQRGPAHARQQLTSTGFWYTNVQGNNLLDPTAVSFPLFQAINHPSPRQLPPPPSPPEAFHLRGLSLASAKVQGVTYIGGWGGGVMEYHDVFGARRVESVGGRGEHPFDPYHRCFNRAPFLSSSRKGHSLPWLGSIATRKKRVCWCLSPQPVAEKENSGHMKQ